MRRFCRDSAIAIPALVLALTPLATADGIQVLRGSQSSLASSALPSPDVVVLRGAQVGGPIPPPEPVATATPRAPTPEPIAPVVQIFIGPVVSQVVPVSVLARRRFPPAKRPMRAVWPHPARADRRDR
jgi:hypothetical protein